MLCQGRRFHPLPDELMGKRTVQTVVVIVLSAASAS